MIKEIIHEVISEMKYDIDKVIIEFEDGSKISIPETELKDYLYSLEEAKKAVKIKVVHPGILEVPPGKRVNELPVEHFIKLAKKKGYAAIIRALNNLQIWNKNRDPELSKWAKEMKEKLRKAREEGKI